MQRLDAGWSQKWGSAKTSDFLLVFCPNAPNKARSPSSAPSHPFFGWEGSPNKIDYIKKGTLILTSLLDDLEGYPHRMRPNLCEPEVAEVPGMFAERTRHHIQRGLTQGATRTREIEQSERLIVGNLFNYTNATIKSPKDPAALALVVFLRNSQG